MFSECKSIKQLPDISKWNISNVNDISDMFSKCILLEYLPDISKWKTSKVTNMSRLFKNCISLTKLPNISIWYTNNVERMDYIFAGCSSLSSLPDTSKWNSLTINNSIQDFSTKKYGEIINVMFQSCHRTFRNVFVPTDIKFIELIKKANLCEILNAKLENIQIIFNGSNINILKNYNKSLDELGISEKTNIFFIAIFGW